MLSRGARKCLDLLRWYEKRFKGDVFPLQATIGRRIGRRERQVRTYLTELRREGLIEIKKYGRNPASYTLAQCSAQVADRRSVSEKNCRSNAGLLPVECRSSGAVSLLTEFKYLDKAKQAAAPAKKSTEAETQNPEVQEALRKALPRIKSARNPEAYMQRIVGDTLASILAREERRRPAKPAMPEMLPEEQMEIEEFVREHEKRRIELERAASGRQGNGARGDPATGSESPIETPCRPLAEEDRESVSGEVAAVLASPDAGGGLNADMPGQSKRSCPPASETPRKPPMGDQRMVGWLTSEIDVLARAKRMGESL